MPILLWMGEPHHLDKVKRFDLTRFALKRSIKRLINDIDDCDNSAPDDDVNDDQSVRTATKWCGVKQSRTKGNGDLPRSSIDRLKWPEMVKRSTCDSIDTCVSWNRLKCNKQLDINLSRNGILKITFAESNLLITVVFTIAINRLLCNHRSTLDQCWRNELAPVDAESVRGWCSAGSGTNCNCCSVVVVVLPSTWRPTHRRSTAAFSEAEKRQEIFGLRINQT